jgi:FtsP/CotA-like multicopper oxidase with cupredoxin domain
MKGKTDVTIGAENEASTMAAVLGRRKFLTLGGAGVVVMVTSGVAAAVIRAGGPNPTLRSQPPVGLDPATGRDPTAISAAPGGVRHLALAGTDGWVSMPSAANTAVGPSRGAQSIEPYFPDPLADPPNTTTYAFCFRNVTGLDRAQVAAQKGRTQICAPLFFSTVGEEIWVTLTNLGLVLRPDLVDGHTLHWHGFRNAIPFYDGVPESSISVPIGRDFTYVYRPQDAGTYMYHCHFEDVEHVTMGMHGIVYVKPDPADRVGLSGGQQKAYGVADGDATGETKYDREYAIMLSEVDTRAHFGDAHIQATDWTDFHADFWTMNGRAYPDTLEPNGVRDETGQLYAQRSNGIDANGNAMLETITDFTSDESRLFSNPLSSLVQCAPGERILIRFANLGFLNHSFVFPGLEVDVLGRDARFVPDSAQRTSTDTIQIGPGESRDVFFTAPAAGTYAFYDRGLSHYTGSADGSDDWVGGQRSEIRVIDGLGAQLKPNGWAGEPVWHGEQPLAQV